MESVPPSPALADWKSCRRAAWPLAAGTARAGHEARNESPPLRGPRSTKVRRRAESTRADIGPK